MQNSSLIEPLAPHILNAAGILNADTAMEGERDAAGAGERFQCDRRPLSASRLRFKDRKARQMEASFCHILLDDFRRDAHPHEYP